MSGLLCTVHRQLGEKYTDAPKWLRNLYKLNQLCASFSFQDLNKRVTNYTTVLCVCSFLVYFGGLSLGIFLLPICPTLKSRDLISRLGFCSLCPNYSLPSTLHAFHGVCVFQSRILPCSFVYPCGCIILFVCFQDCLKPHTLYFIILSSSFTACHWCC